MRITMRLTFAVLVVVGSAGLASAEDGALAGRPCVGEVRSLAISLNNTEAVSELHHDGWLEARGQLLSTAMFSELFKVVGRTWTAKDVKEGQFAIPEILDRSERQLSSDNPYGVLGPGDLVTGGRVLKAWLRQAPLSYWIFVGHDVSQSTVKVVR